MLEFSLSWTLKRFHTCECSRWHICRSANGRNYIFGWILHTPHCLLDVWSVQLLFDYHLYEKSDELNNLWRCWKSIISTAQQTNTHSHYHTRLLFHLWIIRCLFYWSCDLAELFICFCSSTQPAAGSQGTFCFTSHLLISLCTLAFPQLCSHLQASSIFPAQCWSVYHNSFFSSGPALAWLCSDHSRVLDTESVRRLINEVDSALLLRLIIPSQPSNETMWSFLQKYTKPVSTNDTHNTVVCRDQQWIFKWLL